MKKENLKKLLDGMNDIHPVILGNMGVLLLCLPLVAPIEDKTLDTAVFIAAMVMLTYASGCAFAHEIWVRKDIKRKVKEEIEKRKKEICAKRNTKQK